MKTIAMSVTEAARNFSDCINRVRYQGVTFVLHKNGIPVARIVPEPGPGQNGSEERKERVVKRPRGSSPPDRTSSRRAQ